MRSRNFQKLKIDPRISHILHDIVIGTCFCITILYIKVHWVIHNSQWLEHSNYYYNEVVIRSFRAFSVSSS